METDKILEALHKLLPDIQLIYLFGSQNRLDAGKDSDIDLAILTVKEITNINRWDIQEKLAQMMKKDVDLIDLKQANLVMKHQIITTGSCIFCKSEDIQDSYENLVLAMYLNFQETRKDLLGDIQKSGKIYE